MKIQLFAKKNKPVSPVDRYGFTIGFEKITGE